MEKRDILAYFLLIVVVMSISISFNPIGSAREGDPLASGPPVSTGVQLAPPIMTTFKVEPESSTGSVGETITIDVNVSDAEGLWGWQVDMTWDPAILDYSSHTFGDFLADMPEGTATLIFLDMVDSGLLTATETSFGDYPGVTADAGWLISIDFDVVGEGETTIAIDSLFTYWLEDAMTVWGDEEGEMIKENGTFTTGAPPIEYTLTIAVGAGSGTTDPAPGAYTYAEGTVVLVDALPAADWMLDHWELDGVDVGAADPFDVTMNADHDLVAVFTEAPLTEIFLDPSTVSANPGETFTLDVNVSDVTDLYAWGIKLGWPRGLLGVDAADIIEGPFLQEVGSTGFAKKAFADYIDCACTLLGAVSGVNGSGTLVTVTFQVLETGNATLDLYSTILVDSSLVEIPHTAHDGYFYTTWPVADFDYAPNPLDDPGHPIVGETITFDASPSYDPDGGTIVLYEWDFDDGASDTGQIVTHAYGVAGSYLITLAVADDEGETYAASRLILVYPEEADEYFASVVYTPFDSDGDSFEDAVEVQMDVDTTDGPLWVYVDAYLIDPYGSIVDSDFPGWVINGTAVEYGFAYLYVPSGAPEGWYDVELFLYDEWWNYEDYEYGDDVLYYAPSAPSIYFFDAYLSEYVDADGDGYYGSVTAYWDADVDDYVHVDVYVVVWGVDTAGAWSYLGSYGPYTIYNWESDYQSFIIDSVPYSDWWDIRLELYDWDTLSLHDDWWFYDIPLESLSDDRPVIMTTFKVEPENSTGSVGETITIDVNVSDAEGLWGWQVDLLWDPTMLAYSNHTFGDFLAEMPEGTATLIFLDDVEVGHLMATEMSFGDYPGITADAGWLISIDFEVVGDGTTTLDIDTPYTYWVEDTMTVWGDDEGEMIKENGYFSAMLPEVPDVAIVDVVAYPSAVASGEPVNIDATLENQGTVEAVFDVIVKYDGTVIESRTLVLLPGESVVEPFIWDTLGVPEETYTISAEVPPVPGETDTTDNVFTDGRILIGAGWDVVLTATIEDYYDVSELGVRSDATDGFDPSYDEVDPPEPPSSGVVSYFWYPDNPVAPVDLRRLSTSKIPPSPLMTWTYRVKSRGIRGSMVISWSAEDIAIIPLEYGVYLQCPDGAVIDMRAFSDYAFPADSDITYEFTVHVGPCYCELQLSAGWNLVSFPCLPLNDLSFAYILKDVPFYQVLTWDGTSYVTPTYVELGKGYWLLVMEEATVNYWGLPAQRYELDLPAGWSLIGSVSCLVNADAVFPGFYQLYGWNGVSYVSSTTIDPWKGYWVLVLEPTHIVVDCSSATEAIYTGVAINRDGQEHTTLAPTGWFIVPPASIEGCTQELDGSTHSYKDCRSGPSDS